MLPFCSILGRAMGMRKNAKKQGNTVIAAAAAVTDATKDVPVDTATEKVARKSKKNDE